MAPSNGTRTDRTATPSPGLPSAYERLSEARTVRLRRGKLLAVKTQLPKGHFMPRTEDKSGISYTAAQRFMRAAKEAEQPERSST